jgi:hypothetical protein
MTESRYLPLPNTAAYHQMALVALIGFTRVTVITGRYPFSVGACRSKLSVSLAKCFAIGPGPRNLKSARGLWQTLTDDIPARYHNKYCQVFYVVLSTMPFIGYWADLSFYTQPSGCVFFWNVNG